MDWQERDELKKVEEKRVAELSFEGLSMQLAKTLRAIKETDSRLDRLKDTAKILENELAARG